MKFSLVVFGDMEGVCMEYAGRAHARAGRQETGIYCIRYPNFLVPKRDAQRGRGKGGEVVGQHFPERPSPLSNQTRHSMSSVLVGAALVLLSGGMGNSNDVLDVLSTNPPTVDGQVRAW